MGGIVPPPELPYSTCGEAFNALEAHGMQHKYSFVLSTANLITTMLMSDITHFAAV